MSFEVGGAPFYGDGVNDGMPGRNWSPGNLTPYTSPGVPALNWAPGAPGPTGLSFPQGGLPRGIQDNVEMPSNTFISHGYYARAWNNKSELKLVDGQFVFVHRDHCPIRVSQHVYDVHTFCNIAHMNMILRQAWNHYDTQSREGAPAALGDAPRTPAARLAQLRKLHGEHEVAAYECASRLQHSIEANMASQRNEVTRRMQATSCSLVSTTLKELCDFARDPKLCYVVSPLYILDKW